jgi:hypothetical protein
MTGKDTMPLHIHTVSVAEILYLQVKQINNNIYLQLGRHQFVLLLRLRFLFEMLPCSCCRPDETLEDSVAATVVAAAGGASAAGGELTDTAVTSESHTSLHASALVAEQGAALNLLFLASMMTESTPASCSIIGCHAFNSLPGVESL